MGPNPSPTRRNRLRVGLRHLFGAIALILCAVLGLWLVEGKPLVEQVELEVRAGIPIGTPRNEAAAWLEQHYRFIPAHHDDLNANRIRNRTIPDVAGLRAEDYRAMLSTTVRRQGIAGKVLDEISYNHIWVYLFLDEHERVANYFFFSFDDLRKAEAKKG